METIAVSSLSIRTTAQLIFTCSESTIKTLEKRVNYVQSLQ